MLSKKVYCFTATHLSSAKRLRVSERSVTLFCPIARTYASRRATNYKMSQPIDSALTHSTLFLTLTISDAPGSVKTVRSTLGSVSDLSKNVATRDPRSEFCCVTAVGSQVWGQLFDGAPRPAELHPFPVIEGQKYRTVSTPGDLLFHVKGQRKDMCFEFERQLLESFGDSVHVADETWGFQYFDERDLLGFVDGTANPLGADAESSALVTADDDASHAHGSYVVTQKYLHDLKGWSGLKNEQQEAIIGRTKLENVELDDAGPTEQKSHKTLTTVEGQDGAEYDILRKNMPFGSPAAGEFGTYFIGYSRRLWVVEEMLKRMFVGNPPGKHDRILDYSRPVTGATFFAPPSTMLNDLS